MADELLSEDKSRTEPDTPNDVVRAFLREGRLIPAIKAYREQNPGIDLKEAVAAVEKIDIRMKAENLQ